MSTLTDLGPDSQLLCPSPAV